MTSTILMLRTKLYWSIVSPQKQKQKNNYSEFYRWHPTIKVNKNVFKLNGYISCSKKALLSSAHTHTGTRHSAWTNSKVCFLTPISFLTLITSCSKLHCSGFGILSRKVSHIPCTQRLLSVVTTHSNSQLCRTWCTATLPYAGNQQW